LVTVDGVEFEYPMAAESAKQVARARNAHVKNFIVPVTYDSNVPGVFGGL